MLSTLKKDCYTNKYDVRGHFSSEINVDLAGVIGQKFVEYTKAQVVAVGCDNRFSSPLLEEELIKNLNCNVIRLGMCSSPMLYFAVKSLQLDGGIMITASHNPVTDNGFKLLKRNLPLCGDELQNMMSLQPRPNWPEISRGSVRFHDIKKEYIDDLLDGYNYHHSLKILWDPGNCTLGPMVTHLINYLPEHQHVIINNTPCDNKTANPVKTSLELTIAQLRKDECDIGFAFDTDGDRLVVINSQGYVVSNDFILMILINSLGSIVDKSVIVDVKVSKHVIDLVQKLGGKVIVSPTGHSFIKRTLYEKKAILGGEGSGHIFFGEKGYDDGLYAALRLISILSYSNWNKILFNLPKIYTSDEIRIALQNAEHVLTRIKNYLVHNNIVFEDIDGIKVHTEDGWWLVRCSNTEEKIVICCEGYSAKGLVKIKCYLQAVLNGIDCCGSISNIS